MTDLEGICSANGVAAMVALATARPLAATMGVVVKIAMMPVAKAKNS